MNNNQIKNKKVEVPKGIALNEKDYIDALLECLKTMEKSYAIALTEASNEILYQEYKKMFDQYDIMQREVYECMFRKGWYILEKAEATKIIEKYQVLNQEFIDLNE